MAAWTKPARAAATGFAAADLERLLNIEQDGCIEWPHYRTKDGYGRIKIKGKTQRVHVIACTRRHGPRPGADQLAAHTCGNRACLNYRHLRWKTQLANKADELVHGTRQSKLSPDQVRAIRDRYAGGDVTQRALADEYGVSTFTIGALLRRQTWVWLD